MQISLTWCCVCVCVCVSETTDADKFDMVLELVAGIGRVLFKLFQHPSLAIVKSAGLIMKSIIEVGGPSRRRGWGTVGGA